MSAPSLLFLNNSEYRSKMITINTIPHRAFSFDGRNIVLRISAFIRKMPPLHGITRNELFSYMTSKTRTAMKHYCDIDTIIDTIGKYWVGDSSTSQSFEEHKTRAAGLTRLIKDLSILAAQSRNIDASLLYLFSNGRDVILTGGGSIKPKQWDLDAFESCEHEVIYRSFSTPHCRIPNTELRLRRVELQHPQLNMWYVASTHDFTDAAEIIYNKFVYFWETLG